MKTRYFQHLPRSYWTYPSILAGFLKKKEVVAPTLPQAEYKVKPFYASASHLSRYLDICGFENNGIIPAIYFMMLSQSLQMYMMTQEQFPFSVLGLIHLENTLKQYKVLHANQAYGLSCCFGEIETRKNGYAFKFIITVMLADEVVAEGTSTYFYKQYNNNLSQDQKRNETSRHNMCVDQKWSLTENIGRHYAILSGDFNLIHLHAFTAKPFGFKQAIAHGMWSKAKILANLDLPEQYEIQVTFKSPMYLPSEVQFLMFCDLNKTDFKVQDHNLNKTHIIGQVTY